MSTLNKMYTQEVTHNCILITICIYKNAKTQKHKIKIEETAPLYV